MHVSHVTCALCILILILVPSIAYGTLTTKKEFTLGLRLRYSANENLIK